MSKLNVVFWSQSGNTEARARESDGSFLKDRDLK